MSGKSSHYRSLQKKWGEKHKEIKKVFSEKHQDALEILEEAPKQIAAGSLAATLALSSPVATTIIAPSTPTVSPDQSLLTKRNSLLSELNSFLPEPKEVLSPEEEQRGGEIISRYFGVSAAVELQGFRLNRAYGVIGAEQHLMRYPGDTMATHFKTEAETKYYSSGMAPGRGAWGYFASSAGEMTDEIVEREKYYIAVQTFLSPGWGERTKELYQFFKYRKMLVVNPDNGRGIVVVIADAGPAQWTGKHLGGSPEVMNYLSRVDGRARGGVLYYFIDESQGNVPLGPIEIK